MNIYSFLHDATETYTHILVDDKSQKCAIIDPVLDFDPKSGHTHSKSVDDVVRFINEHSLQLVYIIETHAHADHLSAAIYVKEKLGGKIVIGKYISEVQKIFKQVFNFDSSFKTDASQFDILTQEGSCLELGSLCITAMHVPGHTPADMAYVVTNEHAQHGENCEQDLSKKTKTAVFVGDTLFAPDVGTARCDFPGGDAATLYQSIQRLLSLPDDTMIYLCHDYPAKGRKHCPTSTVKAQKMSNIHVKQGISEAEFVQMRERRDAKLDMPQLIIPDVQVNINAGKFPEPEDNGVRYLKVPLNHLS